MTESTHLRRNSYGPTSPTVGSKGARTRQQIVDAAIASFTEHGFHATSIEIMAARASTSRATLYQYFESKDAIFVELMVESGENLVRITRQLGGLGPHADGYHRLAVWVREWVAIYDRHAPMFIEGDSVLAPQAPLRVEVERFVTAYCRKIAKEIAKGGHPDEPARLSAQLVSAMMQRFNFIRHVFRPGLADEQFTASLAVALQLYLFPTTPVDILTANPLAAADTGLPPVSGMGPLAAVPRRGEIEITDPRDALGAQARATATQLLDAARRVINQRGFAAANIDQVVAEAGVARGTFYRYFESLVEPLVLLGLESSKVLVDRFAELPSVVGDPARLRAWLRDVLELQQHYSGVMRAWSECYPVEPGLLATTSDVVVAMGSAVAEIFGPPRPYPFARRACGMLFSGLVEHFPNEAARGRPTPSARQIVEAQAVFIERVILPQRSA